ncbi:histidine--tRNA ligase [Candidatus Woesearchaeota archaeon]|nr:histidine--tRNA ligase [Candidatus Woesearchaeota archaeon]
MVMETLQIRLTRGLIEEISKLVDKGIYGSSSEAVRDAVRRLVLGKEEKIVVPEAKATQEKIEKEIKKQLQGARGTRDILPENQIIKERIISVLKETFELFGYSPLETPVIERFDVLSSKYAGGDEILKETFRLKDQGGRDLGLRYDLTVPLARVVGMNPQLKMPFKRYQIGEVFRDGPVSLGRYRQFIQCDADIIGCKDMTADAECINIVSSAFKRLGFNIEIRINNRKVLNSILEKAGIKESKRDSTILSIDKLEKFGQDAVVKELKDNGIPDTKIDDILGIITIQGKNQEKLEKLKKLIAGNEGLKEVEELIEYLKILDVDAVFDVSLARGLSYYTGTIFETFIQNSRIKSAVCSGGRWDKMIGDFLGRGDYPAVGISFGLERIFDAYIEKNPVRNKTVAQLFIIPIGTLEQSLKTAKMLREKGIKVDIDLTGRGPSKNLNYANSLGIPYVIFIGDNELKQNKVKLKNMETGQEGLVNAEDVPGVLNKKRLSRFLE